MYEVTRDKGIRNPFIKRHNVEVTPIVDKIRVNKFRWFSSYYEVIWLWGSKSYYGNKCWRKRGEEDRTMDRKHKKWHENSLFKWRRGGEHGSVE